MELIIAIAIGLTIWRLIKYFSSQTRSIVQATSSPSDTSSGSFELALHQTVLREKKRIWIKYQDAEGRISQRRIEIYHYDDCNYIFAWCCLRNEPRTFKTNNILQWKVLNERFEANPTVERYIREQLQPKDWSNKIAWGEWQTINRLRQVPNARVEVNAIDDSDYWTGPGKAVSLNGYKILKGGIYVGTGGVAPV